MSRQPCLRWICLAAILVLAGASPWFPLKASPSKSMPAFGRIPLAFEKNNGQTEARFQFVARGAGHAIYSAPGETVVMFAPSATTNRFDQCQVLRFALRGASTNVIGRGLSQLPGRVNHITGGHPRDWTLGVAAFGKVSYPEIYPGIDLVCYGNQELFEYDFVVAPGAEPERIAFQVEGARVEIDSQGDLVLATAGGQVRQHKPLIYQLIAGERQPVEGRFSLGASNVVSFALGSYDRSEALVIDPILSLEYSTYLGGPKVDSAWAVAADSSGNAYFGGETFTVLKNVPAQGYQTNFGGGTKYGGDGFVAKLDPTGTNFLYFSYLGGSSLDSVSGLAVDAAGAVYATGYTISTNFPVIPTNVFQPRIGGTNIAGYNVPYSDAFVTKLDDTGQPVYSTYLGGEVADAGAAIAVDSTGVAYVTGYTESALVFRITNEVRTLRCTNFFGTNLVCGVEVVGTNVGLARLLIDVDVRTNVVLTEFAPPPLTNTLGVNFVQRQIIEVLTTTLLGATNVTLGFPTVNAVQTNNAGSADVFVAKLSADGTSLLYSTYLGGSLGRDFGVGIGLDAAGDFVVAGVSDEPDFPVFNAFQPYFGGGRDAVLAKFDSAGQLVYSTYLGGSLTDIAYGVAVDPDGAAYAVGSTASKDFLGVANDVRPGGVSKSTDGGTNWVLSSAGLTHTGVRALTINPASPATLYAGTPRGVFVSTDSAANWGPSSSGMTNAEVTALALDPLVPSTIYAAADTTLFKSTDAGFSWAAVGTGLPGKEVLSIAFSLFDPAALFLGTRSGFYFSADRGTNFVHQNKGLGTRAINVIAADPVNSGVVYAGADGGVFKSEDGSATWKAVNTGIGNRKVLGLAVNPSAPATVIAGTVKGLFRTVDAGTNWANITNGIRQTQVNTVVYDPGDSANVYAASTNGVFKSSDGGLQWTDISSNLLAHDYVALVVDPSNPALVYTGARGTNFSGGTNDAFLVKLSPDGATLEYAMTFGGNKTDEARAVTLDTNRSAFVAGTTLSKNFPVNNAMNRSQGTNSGKADAFIVQFDPTGSSNVLSILIGGKRNEAARAIALDGMGGVYIAGASDSSDFPVTNAVQTTRKGDKESAFLSKFQWFDPDADLGSQPVFQVNTNIGPGRIPFRPSPAVPPPPPRILIPPFP